MILHYSYDLCASLSMRKSVIAILLLFVCEHCECLKIETFNVETPSELNAGVATSSHV